jgi:8-hydroxy-5-deazaflavin:NADPH oxidoreductase
MEQIVPVIGIIGGSGHLGSALAGRWVKAGLPVLIGSRTMDRAQEAAMKLTVQTGKAVGHGTNIDVAFRAAIVVVTVPFASQAATLLEIHEAVAGKLVIDTTVPLVPPKVMRVQLPPEGCAAMRTQKLLGGSVRVVSAFHNVAAHKLATDGAAGCDILVFGDDKDAREQVVSLAEAAGLKGWHAGPLVNSASAEALTSVLIFMNKHYNFDGAGIAIIGSPKAKSETVSPVGV